METRWKIAALWVLASLAARPSFSDVRPADFDFRSSAGYQYDSNVNVAEIDANTGQGDTALVVDVGVGASLRLNERLSVDLGYAYSGTRYRQFSEFDLSIHHLRGALGYRIAGFDAGLSLDRFATYLDDEVFLNITRVSPSLSRMFGDRLYLRGAFVRAEKSYPELEERNAVNESYRADAYLLLDGMRRYFAFALERDSEDALSDALDYDGIATKLTWGHRLEAGSLPVHVKAHVRFESRDYRTLPDADEGPRRDDRRRFGLGVGLPLAEHFEIAGQAEFTDNASTLEAAVYDEMAYMLSVGAEF